jgi:hypothetical protein
VDIDALIFQPPPQPLDRHVVHPLALARDLDIGIDKHVNKARAGELAALVGVENGGLAIFLLFISGLTLSQDDTSLTPCPKSGVHLKTWRPHFSISLIACGSRR